MSNGITNKEYRQHEGISKSDLFKLTKSPAHFKWHMDHKGEEEKTHALVFGSAAHKYILEKDDFFNEFAIQPVFDRRTKEGKEAYAKFEASCVGKEIITEADFEVIKEMSEVVYSNPICQKILNGDCEQSFFWTDEETNEPCKCRPDCLTEIKGSNLIIDYKTTDNAETDAFMRSAIKYGYDLQAGMYTEGMEKRTGKKYDFVFLAQEKKPPYAINILQCDEFILASGKQLFHSLLKTYHECKESGIGTVTQVSTTKYQALQCLIG